MISDLNYIATEIDGEFKVTPEALIFAEKWYQEFEPSKQNKKLQGYYQRKPTHLLKLAQIYRIAYSDELVIEVGDIEAALGILGLLERRLPQVFEGVGKNRYSLDVRDIVDYVKSSEGGVLEKILLDAFSSAAEPNKLNELLDGLVQIKKISRLPADGGGWLVTYTGG